MQLHLNQWYKYTGEELANLKSIVARVEFLLLHFQDAVNYTQNLLLRYKEFFGSTHFSEEGILRTRRALLQKERKSKKPRFQVDPNALAYNELIATKTKDYYIAFQKV